MAKCLVFFVEGETELDFYKHLVEHARKRVKDGKFDIRIEYKCVKGIGGFKNEAFRKFVKDIRPKYGAECEFTIALCRDTDVFEFSPKPPVRWNEVEKDLRENGADVVLHIEAKHCIEDWFLYDAESIISFLKLSPNTKITGKNGYEKMKNLYKQANKIYFKGRKSGEMIGYLDIDKIVCKIREQIEPIYDVLGVEKEGIK